MGALHRPSTDCWPSHSTVQGDRPERMAASRLMPFTLIIILPSMFPFRLFIPYSFPLFSCDASLAPTDISLLLPTLNWISNRSGLLAVQRVALFSSDPPSMSLLFLSPTPLSLLACLPLSLGVGTPAGFSLLIALSFVIHLYLH